MTEYTVDKKGNVTPKGDGKKPLITKYMKGDIPLTIPKIIKNVKKKIDSFKEKSNPQQQGLGTGRYPQKPKLMPKKNLPERKVPKGEKPNMLDVAGGAKTVRAATGGLISKKKSSSLAKRGYGIAKRG